MSFIENSNQSNLDTEYISRFINEIINENFEASPQNETIFNVLMEIVLNVFENKRQFLTVYEGYDNSMFTYLLDIAKTAIRTIIDNVEQLMNPDWFKVKYNNFVKQIVDDSNEDIIEYENLNTNFYQYELDVIKQNLILTYSDITSNELNQLFFNYISSL